MKASNEKVTGRLVLWPIQCTASLGKSSPFRLMPSEPYFHGLPFPYQNQLAKDVLVCSLIRAAIFKAVTYIHRL